MEMGQVEVWQVQTVRDVQMPRDTVHEVRHGNRHMHVPGNLPGEAGQQARRNLYLMVMARLRLQEARARHFPRRSGSSLHGSRFSR